MFATHGMVSRREDLDREEAVAAIVEDHLGLPGLARGAAAEATEERELDPRKAVAADTDEAERARSRRRRDSTGQGGAEQPTNLRRMISGTAMASGS